MADVKRDTTLDKYNVLDDLARSGYDVDNANEFLKANNYPEMDNTEKKYFWLMQTLSHVPKNAKEIYSGIPTFLGWLWEKGLPGIGRRIPSYIQGGIQYTQRPGDITPEIKEQISSDAKRLRRNGPRIWDSLFANLGLDWERVRNTFNREGDGISLNASGQAMRTHPIDTALMIAPLANPAGKLIEATPVGQELARATEFNNLLNRSITEASASTSKLDKLAKDFTRAYEGLNPSDKISITEAITLTGNRDLGSKKLNRIAKQGRVLGKSISREYAKADLIPRDVNAKNIIANNLGNALNWDGGKLTHQEVMGWLDNPEAMPKRAKELLPHVEDMQRRGDITFLSQMLNPSVNTQGIPIERASDYARQARIIGTRTPAELAELVPQSFDAVIRRLRGYKTAENALTNLPKSLGIIGGSELEQALKQGTSNLYDADTLFGRTSEAAMSGATPSTVLRGLEPAGKNSRYGIYLPDSYKDAFANAVGGGTPHPVLSAWKRSQLITPKWIIENRIGNMYNNAVEGVGPLEYTQALANQNKMPDLLKHLTSYSGYTGDVSGLDTWRGLTEALKETGNAFKDIGRGDVGKGLLGFYKGTSNMVSQPIVRMESSLEGLDRYANLIKQGKRLGYSLDDMRADPDKFWIAYDRVDKSLGDYTGRNHFLSNVASDVVNQVMPFWKFPAQTIRTTVNQAKDHPIRFALMNRMPTNLGSEMYQDVLARNNEQDPMMEGGYPTGNQNIYGGNEYVRSESIPYTTFTGMLRSLTDPSIGIEEAVSNISPTFNIGNLLTGKPYKDRPYTSSKFFTDKYGVQVRKDEKGEPYPEEYKPSFKDYAGYLGAQAAKNWYAPGVFASRVARPIYKGVVDPIVKDYSFNEATMYPMYDDTINPLSEGNIYSQPKVGFEEIVGPQFGLKTTSIYNPTTMPSQITDVGLKGAIKRAFRKYNANQAQAPAQDNELRNAISNYLQLFR